METAVHYHNASASPLAYQHPAKTLNFPTHVPFLMRLPADLLLKAGVTPNKSLQELRVFCVDNHIKHMATKSNQESTKDENIRIKEEAKQEAKEPPPPPPEKPEPGDCCGSGCVRCVWDVYYEELEAYNKLHRSDSTNSRSN